ncbi:MAG: hypothetical protein ABJZ69_08980 [Hyphomicrobiales bacterium]
MTIAGKSGAQSTECPAGIVAVNITSTADVHHLTDALACVGEGFFNITWYSSLTIYEMIEVSDEKEVTVTGVGVRSFRGADVVIDAGSGTGIFSVSGGSTLHLHNVVLKGGNTENGGAVAVLSSSAFFAFDCTFRNNNASNGGETPLLGSNAHLDGRVQSQANDEASLIAGTSCFEQKKRRRVRHVSRMQNIF